eukprot:CAMPEP_0180676602 /NCGR_PEP_ID=MMETSP1037_2-20121125/67403_1 /TAXON_ID=632150 /ORGANISM="Azadinium spinosum, Strain 3D9" /LENGTH=49 /DNA_ID= /DNA_START= /DNA_END= /DNA_ORIENTATION=
MPGRAWQREARGYPLRARVCDIQGQEKHVRSFNAGRDKDASQGHVPDGE